MANTKSAAKRARQTVARTSENKRVLTGVKTRTKVFQVRLKEGNREAAAGAYRDLASALDKAAKTGQLHRNAAARQKSRFNKKLAALS